MAHDDAVERTVQQAIDEWSTIAGGPHADGEPKVTLAHYIAVKLGERRGVMRCENCGAPTHGALDRCPYPKLPLDGDFGGWQTDEHGTTYYIERRAETVRTWRTDSDEERPDWVRAIEAERRHA